jgi:hypothetical protein
MTVSLDSLSVIVAKSVIGNKRPGLAPPVSTLLNIADWAAAPAPNQFTG